MTQLFTRRDVDMLKIQRELMRRASLTSPEIMLGGEDLMVLRKFAQETLMLMRSLYPDKFRDATLEAWLAALRQYVASRRPEFRREIMDKLKVRYAKTPPDGKPSELLASQAAEGMAKKAGRKPTLIGSLGRGAALVTAIHTMIRSPSYLAAYSAARKQGIPHKAATLGLTKHFLHNAKLPAAAGAAGGMFAHPFAVADWRKREERKKQ